MLAPVEGTLVPIRQEGGSIDPDSVDPNDMVLSVLLFRFRTYSDNIVVEGPYHPVSLANTLVDVPEDLPSLEEIAPIPIPPPMVHGQCAVRSQGHPNLDYQFPSPHSPPPAYSHHPGSPHYHPYFLPKPAGQELVD